MNIKTGAVLGVIAFLIPMHERCQAQQTKKQAEQPKSAPAASRDADRTAIREMFVAFARSFEARDAKALVEHFTAECEFQNVQGVKLHGRDALAPAFAKFFADTPEVKAEVQSESLRFVSQDSAIDEGSVTIRRGPAAAAEAVHYKAVLVREGGKWRLAVLDETAIDDSLPIASLGWLIGSWKSSAGDGAEIQTTYSWSPSKKFIQSQFTIKEKNLALTGMQVIGVDPATGLIHSWTFEANGGVGEADWIRDGDHWVLDAAGSLPDGGSLVETNILRRVNDDTFTWQSVGRTLGGAALEDLAPVKVTRVKDHP